MPENNDSRLPQNSESYWLQTIDLPRFPSLEKNMHVDVVIVGGGITGITTAYLLTKQGYQVALLEADELLHGTTGHTTAKITAQHGLIYDELMQNIGKDKAQEYYQANTEALQFIEETIKQHNIDCAFTKQDAYLYATTENSARQLETEAKAYEELGIDGELVEDFPIKDMDVKKALVMRNQAQFHPTKYLSHLVQTITDKGGYIFENTTATDVETDEQPSVLTRNGQAVQADYVIACTHFPFYEGTGFYSARMYASRSYILAAKTNRELPDGMYINAEQPARSLRSVNVDGENMVLIAGDGHKTGQDDDTMKHYQALETFGREILDLDEVVYRWSAQDLVTLDKIPYIGNITSDDPRILIATGFRKWGMSNGTAAALLLTDIVAGKDNPYHDLYTPSRFHADPSLKNILTDNANVVSELVKGKLSASGKKIKDLSNDEGIAVAINGERKGAYKDNRGNIYIVDTTCTHIGCEVKWNQAERTWDCPCHGSRFSYTGDVIEGPAETPLQTYDYHMIDNLLSDDSGY